MAKVSRSSKVSETPPGPARFTGSEAQAIVEQHVFDAKALVALLVESWPVAEPGETEIDVARRRTVQQIGEHLEAVAATF